MKILVTGATGFIGLYIVKRLIEKGHDVICMVRETSNTAALDAECIAQVTGDIACSGNVSRVFDEAAPEVVFHCAAGVMEKDEKLLYRANVTGTQNICVSCREHDIKRLVYLSSVAVVNGNSDVPVTDDLPYKSSNAYGSTKGEAEQIVLKFREEGLSAAVIRPCIVYGEDEPHAFDRILKLIYSRRIPLLDMPEADGNLQLAYIGNLIDALELALEKDEALEGTFIIADTDVITIKRFIEILYDEMGRGAAPSVPGWLVKAFIWMPPLRKKFNNFFKDRLYDVSHAVEKLGYAPRVRTEEGLRRCVRYWKEKNQVGVICQK